MALQAGLPLDVWGSGFANQRAAVLDAEAAELERINGMRLLSTLLSMLTMMLWLYRSNMTLYKRRNNQPKRC